MHFSLVAWVATGDVNTGARIVLSAVPAQVRVRAAHLCLQPTPSDHVGLVLYRTSPGVPGGYHQRCPSLRSALVDGNGVWLAEAS